MRYAGFWLRVAAHIIDSIVLYIMDAIITFGRTEIVAPEDFLEPNHLFTLLTVMIFTTAYYVIMESSKWQATIGKRIVGLKVVDLNGQRITVGRAFVRYLAKIISGIFTLGIGIFMIGWTKRKQGLHDKIASTLVIRK